MVARLLALACLAVSADGQADVKGGAGEVCHLVEVAGAGTELGLDSFQPGHTLKAVYPVSSLRASGLAPGEIVARIHLVSGAPSEAQCFLAVSLTKSSSPWDVPAGPSDGSEEADRELHARCGDFALDGGIDVSLIQPPLHWDNASNLAVALRVVHPDPAFTPLPLPDSKNEFPSEVQALALATSRDDGLVTTALRPPALRLCQGGRSQATAAAPEQARTGGGDAAMNRANIAPAALESPGDVWLPTSAPSLEWEARSRPPWTGESDGEDAGSEDGAHSEDDSEDNDKPEEDSEDAFIALLSPARHSTMPSVQPLLTPGHSYVVRWIARGDLGPLRVELHHLNPGRDVTLWLLHEGVPNTGSWTWHLAQGMLPDGANYHIHLISTRQPEVRGESGAFIIKAGGLVYVSWLLLLLAMMGTVCCTVSVCKAVQQARLELRRAEQVRRGVHRAADPAAADAPEQDEDEGEGEGGGDEDDNDPARAWRPGTPHEEQFAAVTISSFQCCICMDHAIDTVFVPCGHSVACGACAHSCATCPICRGDIERIVKVFQK
mmetsp:Transcript_13342/g.35604  ORF Transcript_13342/g.35604 Transcript_13342/m.35604 type:complete len:550 (+) Transcript_13342:61-1710(+)